MAAMKRITATGRPGPMLSHSPLGLLRHLHHRQASLFAQMAHPPVLLRLLTVLLRLPPKRSQKDGGAGKSHRGSG